MLGQFFGRNAIKKKPPQVETGLNTNAELAWRSCEPTRKRVRMAWILAAVSLLFGIVGVIMQNEASPILALIMVVGIVIAVSIAAFGDMLYGDSPEVSSLADKWVKKRMHLAQCNVHLILARKVSDVQGLIGEANWLGSMRSERLTREALVEAVEHLAFNCIRCERKSNARGHRHQRLFLMEPLIDIIIKDFDFNMGKSVKQIFRDAMSRYELSLLVASTEEV